MSRFGFIRGTRDSKLNPDGLPVGFARDPDFNNPMPSGLDVNPATGKPYQAIGFTCAACHTGQLEYRNTRLLIDGGPAMMDLGLLRDGIRSALFSLVVEGAPAMPPAELGQKAGAALKQLAAGSARPSARLLRFVSTILKASPKPPSPEQQAAVLQQVVGFLGAALKDGQAEARAIRARLAQGQPIVEEGFTRLDALARIGNQIFWTQQRRANGVVDASLDPNFALPNAPVNFPPIWDAPWFDWVQYDGSIMQPMFRNFSEALGVGALVNLGPASERQLHSTVKLDELYQMERQLAGRPPFEKKAFAGLTAPKWPEKVLGAIDRQKAAQGESLYASRCQGCHLPPPDDAAFWTTQYWKNDKYPQTGKGDYRYLELKLVELKRLGTDPAQAANLMERKIQLPAALGGKLVSYAAALKSVEAAVEKAYDLRSMPPQRREEMNGNRPNELRAELAYRPRPLNGTWATPPYLHNGSVPSLYALLSPVAERPAEFYLGSRQFDPEKLGFAEGPEKGLFRVDTRKPGNLNTGHGFEDGEGKGIIGPKLSHEQRLALIEYVKTL